MRIIRFLDDENREHYGLESKGESTEVLQGDLYAGLSPSGTTAPIAKLLAPIEPVNIYCIGLNYREHAAESGMDEPKLPIVDPVRPRLIHCDCPCRSSCRIKPCRVRAAPPPLGFASSRAR